MQAIRKIRICLGVLIGLLAVGIGPSLISGPYYPMFFLIMFVVSPIGASLALLAIAALSIYLCRKRRSPPWGVLAFAALIPVAPWCVTLLPTAHGPDVALSQIGLHVAYALASAAIGAVGATLGWVAAFGFRLEPTSGRTLRGAPVTRDFKPMDSGIDLRR